MELSTLTYPQVVYDGAVTRVDLESWSSDLEELFTRMGPVFYRTESRRHAEQYLLGLLAPIQRKNGWTIAEYVGESEPKALQRFLNLSPWDVDRLLELNRDYVLEHFASPSAILVADPTGFAKKGTKSVGVQRQYSGTLGRVDNCQIATFLAYVTPDRVGYSWTAACICPRTPGWPIRRAAPRRECPPKPPSRPGRSRSSR
jgi:SRSO17 transposase